MHENAWREGILQVLQNTKSEQHQTEQKEQKIRKNTPRKNKKTSRKQILLKKVYQKKQLSSLRYKILYTIFKMEKSGTQTNWLKEKKIDK